MSLIYRSLAAPVFRSILWYTTNDMAVHLTFDDGPHPRATPRVLEILKSRELTATFFLVGENAKQYPDLVREIHRLGHSVGNHAMTHRSLLFRAFSWQFQQIEETNNVIASTLGRKPSLFRPPFGRFDPSTLKAASSCGLRTVMWDVDSKDFVSPNCKETIARVSRQTRPGSIVLLHDNDATAPRINGYLNPILDELQKRNLRFSHLGL